MVLIKFLERMAWQRSLQESVTQSQARVFGAVVGAVAALVFPVIQQPAGKSTRYNLQLWPSIQPTTAT